MPKIPDNNVHTFCRGNRKESEGNITEVTVTISEDEHFELSSSSLTPSENDTNDQHATSKHKETTSTARDAAEYTIGPIEVPLNDDKGCVFLPNENEEKNENKPNHNIKSKRTLYGANAKESHPFFDGRFIEVNGMIQINEDFGAHRELAGQRLRRGRRRRPAPVPKTTL